MLLKKLRLRHFRSYTDATFSFSSGVNWITGKNGKGKTNLLEAIYLLSTGRSFRTLKLDPLIQKGASFFYLEAELEEEGTRQILKISYDGKTKNIELNATHYAQFSALIGMLPHVIYAPEDIEIIGGSPAFRRKLLNLHLAQIDSLYIHHLTRYQRAMSQRNELLKQKQFATIDPWEQVMAESATYMIQKRKEMVEQLTPLIDQAMQALSSGEENLELAYKSSLPPTDFLHYWKEQRPKDELYGYTLHGPHRDDLHFLLKDLSAKTFASEGQKHSLIAALRLAEWQLMKQKKKSPPILSIDDFGAHLDTFRQQRLEQQLHNLGQIFLTSTEPLSQAFPNKQILLID